MDLNVLKKVMTPTELAALKLRALYCEKGYSHYKMSKFEEYDLYAKNKEFLISDNIITFTDTDGRLMALKPDVTLSIIKNNRGSFSGDLKLYYNENVYRVSKGTHSFKEIMQVGLECIGEISNERIVEVLYLAKKSLDELSSDNLLEISNLDIVRELLSGFSVSDDGRAKIFSYLGAKNLGGIRQVCSDEGISSEYCELLLKLVSVYGEASQVCKRLDCFAINEGVKREIDRLKAIVESLYAANINKGVIIDFSVVNDMRYYNGIAIKGFIDGIPVSVLSGGQYDSLMHRMHKEQRAIGFAVYLDELERLPQ